MLNKKCQKKREKIIKREKHPGRVAQGHKLAAHMKKRKEKILRNKNQSSEQSKKQSSEQPSVQPSVQSNDTYVYGVGILAVLAIGVCVFFTFQSKNKKLVNKKQDQPPHPQSLSLKNPYNK